MMAALTVEARLGETEEEIEKRFGKPISAKNDKRTYATSGGLTVSVVYKHGKSASEFYSKGQSMTRSMADELMRRFYGTAKVGIETDDCVIYATPRGVIATWHKKDRELFLVVAD